MPSAKKMTKNSIKYKVLSIKIAILFVSLIFFAAACNKQSLVPTASIGGHNINIEIADTEAMRVQGLSGRDFLDANSGMLFLFEAPGKYTFWMKDMQFPLDFIWIKDGRVVEITANVPNSNLQIYEPAQLVDSMIEVNAGWTAKNNIKIRAPVVLTK